MTGDHLAEELVLVSERMKAAREAVDNLLHRYRMLFSMRFENGAFAPLDDGVQTVVFIAASFSHSYPKSFGQLRVGRVDVSEASLDIKLQVLRALPALYEKLTAANPRINLKPVMTLPWDEGGRDEYYSQLPGDDRLVAGLDPIEPEPET